jgi:predicted kinase
VFYDLSFLLMDLVRHGASATATVILNRYLLATADAANEDGLALLPLFMSIRAAIRAQVTAAKLARPSAVARDDVAEMARGYFALAGTLANPPPPRLVAVGGLSGTGKSVLAGALASRIKPEPGAIHLRSDVERKRLAGVSETTALPSSHYTKDESARLYEHLRRRAAAILDAGYSVIVDAVHATADERALIKAVAEDRAIAFHGLFLTASLDVRQQRVGRRVGDASDADTEVARKQEEYDLGRIDWTEVDASKTPEGTLKLATAALGSAARLK